MGADTIDSNGVAPDDDAPDNAPILEFYDGDAAVLVVLPLEETEGVALVALDPTQPDETVVTEYADLDTVLEDNMEQIEALFAAAPVVAADASAEQAWNAACLLISPSMDPLIVTRTEAGAFQVLDPVETADGRPGDQGTFDTLIDAVWAAIEVVFGPDEDEDEDDEAPPSDGPGAGPGDGDPAEPAGS